MGQYEIVGALGIFTGCVCRAVLPFLKKQSEAGKNGDSLKWEARYTWTIVLTLVIALVSTMFLLPTFAIPETYIFPAGFIVGWSAQDIVNKVAT